MFKLSNMNKKKLYFIVGLLCMLLGSCGNSNYWDGEWTSENGKIKVILNSSTMEADVTVRLGDGPVHYTTEWEYIDDESIVYSSYAPNQYVILEKNGEMSYYRPRTEQIIETGIRLKKK